MKWVSVDVGKKMGVTIWDGDCRKETFLIKPRGNKGNYYFGDHVVPSKLYAIECMFQKETSVLVVERGMGGLAAVVNAQAHLRGYISAIADQHNVPVKEINVSEWRRVVKEQMGVSFPRQSKDCKILAQQLVKKHFNLDATEDEADSVLIGYAAMKLGYVNL